MTDPSASPIEPIPLAVLNPLGRDAEVSYSEELPGPASGGHPPVNYHGYAACSRGGFFRDPDRAIDSGFPIVMLITKRLGRCLKTLEKIRRRDRSRPVAVIAKETGTHQLTRLLDHPRRLGLFSQLVQEADGCLSPTEQTTALFRAIRSQSDPGTVQQIPTPYPIEDERWNFSNPLAVRDGIVIGTREFLTMPRAHLLALLAMRDLPARLSVMNTDGRRGEQLLRAIGFPSDRLVIKTGRLGYPDYLRWLSSHRLVFQWDQSLVPGQVAGDAALCRMPCVGGNGLLNTLLFPLLHSHGRSLGDLRSLCERLLTDDAFHTETVAGTERLAGETVSHSAVIPKLNAFVEILRSARNRSSH